jgi:hypothetical protein
MLWLFFFGISSTPMQLVTYNEFSLIIIVKQSIIHWFNIKNTIIYDRKGLHHDFEIFQARCLGRFFWYFFNTNATCHMFWVYSDNYCKIEYYTNLTQWILKHVIGKVSNTIWKYFRLDNWDVFWYFFNTNATCTFNEFSLIINVKQSIIQWLNMNNTIICDRKGLNHDLEIFQARCYGCFLVFLQHQCNLSHVLSFIW